MANSIEEALYEYLPTQISDVRLYWLNVPDSSNPPTRPYVVFDTIASPDEPPYIGEYGSIALIQLSVWGEKHNGLALANSIVSALDQFSGTMVDHDVFQISMNGPLTIKDPDFLDLIQYVVEAEIHYSRGIA